MRPLTRAAALLSVAGLLLAGCVDGGEEPLVDPGPPEIQTWVDDWRDEVIYEVLVDRFENGDPDNDVLAGVGTDENDLTRHQGGDWRGLRERLDYIAALGATAIWISPIVANVDHTASEDGYHGYWASDFTRLNPRFGDLAELRRLVNAAHARGIKVIVDVVTNHTGRVFDYDLDEDGELDADEVEPPFRASAYEVPLLWNVADPPYLFADGFLAGSGELLELGPSAFRRRGFGGSIDPAPRVYGDFYTGLRDLDTEQEELIAALAETYAYWVRETDVDGFRVDAVPHQEVEFWPRWGAALRARLSAMGKERFLLLGETFSLSSDMVATYSREDGALDTSFDFPARGYFLGDVILGGLSPADAAHVLADDRALYRDTPQPGGIGLDPWESRVLIVDNHDTRRIRGEIDNDAAVHAVLFALFALDGIPCLYYGTEQDFAGTGYAASRERMWDSGFATGGATFRFLRRLIDFRMEHPALRRGSLEVLYAAEEGGMGEAEDGGMVAWSRSTSEEQLLVVLNTRATLSSRATFATGLAPGSELVDRWDGSTLVTVDDEGSVSVELAPRTWVVLAPR